jgi:hypothetical protein
MAAIIAALLGWRNAALGRDELKILAIVVLGWTAVTTAASGPHFSMREVAVSLLVRTLVISLPYTVAAWAKRLRSR